MAQTSKQYIQRLQIIHAAQMVMISIFSFIAYISRPALMEGHEMFLYILAAITMAGIVGSRFVFTMLITKAQNEPTLTAKLTRYLTAYIVRLAFLEAPGFFAAVIVLITGNIYAFLATVGILMMFFLVRPTPDLIKLELQLGGDQRTRIEDPNGVVME
ncbi:hypothetical protein [Pseudochryseolinea flava]|uniref:Uncharacterized protein n=1 Tax=Pseudochryseolinea flava TaxID=2059302 RepID=A0A364XZC4_9BACT|nr:hypothetical protein [Pseudochryseolinea flava]RAV99833.1 hypothetical protein DQQ10_17480 [Pseudochryseolinea flava]